ncbi:hypothetical protein ACIBBB_29050 [Streptomyces sp. NPDC051217]|uniref:hypothetical protein n=1 Tax=Streptomyces sp. NPDC051217 TaxID=3365644 RepID=UPI0037A77D70
MGEAVHDLGKCPGPDLEPILRGFDGVGDSRSPFDHTEAVVLTRESFSDYPSFSSSPPNLILPRGDTTPTPLRRLPRQRSAGPA